MNKGARYMKAINIKVEALEETRIEIGFVGENERVAVMIDCRAVFDEYQDAGVSMAVRPPRGESYPAVVSREGDIVKWIVTDSDLICNGNGEIQLVFVDGDTIVKTAIGKTVIERSIVPTGDVPTPIQNWLDQVDQMIAEIERKAEEANTSANNASGSATAAAGSASEAAGSATAAAGSAGAAATSAAAASGSAATATGAATAAAGSANAASGSATAAAESAARAGSSANVAAGCEATARESAAAAVASATSANRDANRAEQAASNAGFMEMEIDGSGHLIYTKSEAIGNKFALDDDGHLILEVG